MCFRLCLSSRNHNQLQGQQSQQTTTVRCSLQSIDDDDNIQTKYI